MGGDHGPAVVVEGAAAAVREFGASVILVGDRDAIEREMARLAVGDLGIEIRHASQVVGIEIVGVPTVREPDGVAMSSRNRRLSTEERTAARCVPRALEAAADAVASGETRASFVVAAAKRVIAAEPLARLEYAELCHPVTLERVDDVDGQPDSGAQQFGR